MQHESVAHGEPAQIGDRATVGTDVDPSATLWLNPSLPAENEPIDRDRDTGTDAEHVLVTAGS